MGAVARGASPPASSINYGSRPAVSRRLSATVVRGPYAPRRQVGRGFLSPLRMNGPKWQKPKMRQCCFLLDAIRTLRTLLPVTNSQVDSLCSELILEEISQGGQDSEIDCHIFVLLPLWAILPQTKSLSWVNGSGSAPSHPKERARHRCLALAVSVLSPHLRGERPTTWSLSLATPASLGETPARRSGWPRCQTCRSRSRACRRA